MAAAEIHLGDIGTEFRVRVIDENGTVVDLSAATTRQIKFTKPGTSTAVVKTATPGSTHDPAKTAALGYMHYLSVSGDLNVRGEWKVQGYVVVGTWTGHTAMERFTVYSTL